MLGLKLGVEQIQQTLFTLMSINGSAVHFTTHLLKHAHRRSQFDIFTVGVYLNDYAFNWALTQP